MRADMDVTAGIQTHVQAVPPRHGHPFLSEAHARRSDTGRSLSARPLCPRLAARYKYRSLGPEGEELEATELGPRALFCAS